MKKILLPLLAIFALTQIAAPTVAQTKTKKPKNAISQLKKNRKKHHVTRQVTPDPKKSPGKHADNLSKNVNHEVNRESKDINHAFQNHPKKKTPAKK